MNWIKTKDSVPDKNTRYATDKSVKVLVAAPIKSGRPPFICTYVFKEKQFVENVIGARGMVAKSVKAKYWRPLPEQPGAKK